MKKLFRSSTALSVALVAAACADIVPPTLPGALPAKGAANAAAPSRPSVVPDQYIIAFEDDVPDAAAAASELAARYGISVRHVYGTAIKGFSARVPAAALAALENDPRVSDIDPDHIDQLGTHSVGATFLPRLLAAAAEEIPWGVDRIDAEKAWSSNSGGGIHVYIVDTGIDADHPDLVANLGNGFAPVPCSTTCLTPWDDENGHGTHVAGTVGAARNGIGVVGVAPNVTLHAVKVFPASGGAFRSDIIAGLDWVAAETKKRGKPSVANLSIGGEGSSDNNCGRTSGDLYHQAFCNARDVLDPVNHVGVLFAVSAGNDFDNARVKVPAAYDDAVMATSATQGDRYKFGEPGDAQNDDWTDFSNWGTGSAQFPESGPVVLAAPGSLVNSTWIGGGYRLASGTSMAAPHAAGVLALYLNARGPKGYFQARADVRALGEDHGCGERTVCAAPGWQNENGVPRYEPFVNAERAAKSP